MNPANHNITHDRLQADCYQWHHNTYPEDRHLVHANISNSVGGRYGNHNKAIGVKRGRADLQYFKSGKLYLFEFKVGYDKQKPEQIEFMIANTDEGAYYFLIFAQDEYQRIIDTIRLNLPYDPFA
ncbi:hypothetical protein [Spirosoma arcticum]